MRTRTLLLSAALMTLSFGPFGRADEISIIPQPKLVQAATGTFTVTRDTPVVVDASPAASDAAGWITKLLGTKEPTSLPAGGAMPAGSILLTTDGADAALGDEGYALDVTANGVVIRAPHAAGMFYGVVSLVELLPPTILNGQQLAEGGAPVPLVHIVDQPRFSWRGESLDVSRHFEPKEAVLQLLDQMALHKLNVFHWHLTDDQGWRIEIKQYPKLTSVGAWRDSAGFGLDPKLSTTYGPDGKYGGFYTQDDVKEVLAAATARHIMVVPEIEMPGHASAALRAYPEFGVPMTPSTDAKGDAGIFNGVYDPANEATFTFLQNVLSEVIDLFPSPFIHVGGDEVPKGPWEHNPPDIAFMKAHGMTSADQLQSYFVQRIGKFVASKGRRMIGWDEILEGGLAPDATVMSWRGTEGGKAAAAADHDVVMTPNPFTYWDGEQSDNFGAEPHTRGAVLTVQKAYTYEPVPEGLPANQVHHVLGTQGCLWTEYVPNMPWAEYLIWPREAALSEVAWTPAADRNWDRFAKALPLEQQRLDAMGVNYRPIESDSLGHNIHLVNGQITIDPVPGTTTRFTLDGNFPMPDSPEYTGPIALPSGWVQVAARYFRDGVVATEATAATFLDGKAVTVTATSPKDWDARQTAFYTQRWGGGPDDTVTITFDGSPQPVHSIAVTSGEVKLTDAVLESSTDGTTFTTVGTFGPDGSANADLGGKTLAAVRIRFTKMQMPHPIIKTVTVN